MKRPPGVGKLRSQFLIAGTVLSIVIAYFIYQRTQPRCDGIFEQTVTKLGGNVEFIKTKGSLFIGPEKVQELTQGAQEVALHLKTCCIAQQSSALNTDQFLGCLNGAKDYESRVLQVTTFITEAQAAKDQGNLPLLKQKADQATAATSEVKTAVTQLGKITATIKTEDAAPPKPVNIGDSEQEPNNNIPQANEAKMGRTIAGEITPAGDVDFYKFQYQDSKNRRDIIALHLENPTPALRPGVRIYAEDKQVLKDWSVPNTAGANVDIFFSAAPAKIYFVEVTGWDSTAGKYSISAMPQKAWDQYEPNDDPSIATPITFGQTVTANIMDNYDVDWYHITGVTGKTVTVHLENQSQQSLRPGIQVRSEDKQVLQDWNVPNSAGADVNFSITTEPGKSYFLVVSGWDGTAGKYKLSTH